MDGDRCLGAIGTFFGSFRLRSGAANDYCWGGFAGLPRRNPTMKTTEE